MLSGRVKTFSPCVRGRQHARGRPLSTENLPRSRGALSVPDKPPCVCVLNMMLLSQASPPEKSRIKWSAKLRVFVL